MEKLKQYELAELEKLTGKRDKEDLLGQEETEEEEGGEAETDQFYVKLDPDQEPEDLDPELINEYNRELRELQRKSYEKLLRQRFEASQKRKPKEDTNKAESPEKKEIEEKLYPEKETSSLELQSVFAELSDAGGGRKFTKDPIVDNQDSELDTSFRRVLEAEEDEEEKEVFEALSKQFEDEKARFQKRDEEEGEEEEEDQAEEGSELDNLDLNEVEIENEWPGTQTKKPIEISPSEFKIVQEFDYIGRQLTQEDMKNPEEEVTFQKPTDPSEANEIEQEEEEAETKIEDDDVEQRMMEESEEDVGEPWELEDTDEDYSAFNYYHTQQQYDQLKEGTQLDAVEKYHINKNFRKNLVKLIHLLNKMASSSFFSAANHFI